MNMDKPTKAEEVIKSLPEQKKSGFRDIEKINVCNHREHKPPGHLHIPQGKEYVHVCPGCGLEIVLRPLQIRC